MARAFGAYGERVTEAGKVVPAIERGVRATREGAPAVLEFITAKEVSVSKFRAPARSGEGHLGRRPAGRGAGPTRPPRPGSMTDGLRCGPLHGII